jgi:hypothetical protein
MLDLGFLINAHTMVVTWAYPKRMATRDTILHALQQGWLRPREVASILGTLRSASILSAWGPYLSFSLSAALKQAVRAAFSPMRNWWHRGKVCRS